MKALKLSQKNKPSKSDLLAQHPHRIFQAFEREREHAVADQLLDDADALECSKEITKACGLYIFCNKTVKPLISFEFSLRINSLFISTIFNPIFNDNFSI